MKFSDIRSHEDVKEQLRALVDNDRVPHALLLEGPAGIGKMQLARAFVQYLHCTNRTPDGDSCGCCPACIQHQTFNHIDTHFSFPVIKKKSGGTVISDDWIEQWREFLAENPYMDFAVWQEKLDKKDAQPLIYVDESAALIRKLNFTAHAARYMVVLMWLPEKMKEECANKLLKLIEEPHDDTIFVLVSNESRKILPTIYSRLRRIAVRRLPDEAIAEYLDEKFDVDRKDALAIAHLAEGSILAAEKRLAAKDTNKEFLDLFMSLMRNAYQSKTKELKAWADAIAGMGREKSMQFMSYCERMTGENYISNLHNPQLVYLDSGEAAFSRNFAPFINEKNVESLRKTFINAREYIGGNANAKIVLFDVALKVALLIKAGAKS